MRANRDDDTPYVHELPRTNYTWHIVGGIALLLALLFVIGIDDEDEVTTPAIDQPVVRDSAVVAPPAVDTPASPQAQDAPNPREGFSERQLAPPSSTVGAGTAPISESVNRERLVIDGELLEELEQEAQPDTSRPPGAAD